MEHPHVHMIVTAGGISTQGERWVRSGKKFFIPVKVISPVFRGKFMSKLKQAYSNGDLVLQGSIMSLRQKNNFKQLLDILYEKGWVVYAKRPFGNPANVLKYLGRYTHRIAISNHRIVDMDDQKVSFNWKDYADKNLGKVMSLHASEFIRRFLLHILPKGFCKIRYYGLAASRNKKPNVAFVRKLLNAPDPVYIPSGESWQETLFRLTGFNVSKCPKCKKGEMRTVRIFEKYAPT